MNYPVVLGGDDLANLYGAEAMPATFLIGRDGRIASADIGRLVDKAACEKDLRKLLATPGE